jgi:hypothetical protein
MPMSVLPKVAGAVLVIGIGAGLWAAGQIQTRHATTRRAFLMMRYAAPAEENAAIGRARRFLPARWRDDLRTRQAESHYWLAQYGLLARATDAERSATNTPDAVYLMLVANAAYREVAGALTEETPAERLDDIAGLYLDVLEHDPGRIDAAYNYEYVVRRKNTLLRDRAVRRRGAATAATPPPGATLHGRPGAPPPQTDMGDFKIIVPQRPEERRRQPDAGAGAGRGRKG